ncbi:MAG: cysteine synthase, partial [Nitrosopumilaceae archaeon]|nr:cysteine synthase [Nitrosopumilaceae archaeon]NIU87590.1 cysteine synthase [Nitrosopumilaceae archaeon]NIV66032.1 cysteine synthase [Nitrosopumilaceae archaeon]NIX61837.1 cysteine synthase [Nitrosopumilaceae archaeon]
MTTQQIPDELNEQLQGSKGKSLLVCMAGNTSLMAVKVLAKKGVKSQSLSGGITALPQAKQKQLPELIKIATE